MRINQNLWTLLTKLLRLTLNINQMGLLLLTKKLCLVYILQKNLSGILTCFLYTTFDSFTFDTFLFTFDLKYPYKLNCILLIFGTVWQSGGGLMRVY